MSRGTAERCLLRLTIAARVENLKEVRAALRKALSDTVRSSRDMDDIVLAADEACQNIIRHAYGADTDAPIELEARQNGRRLTLLLRDFADPSNVDKIRPRELDDLRPGGLGTHFMREIMDEVEYQPVSEPRSTLLRMTKRLDRDS